MLNHELPTTAYIREGWLLGCPAPRGGSLAIGVYYSGAGLADDTEQEADECSRMQLLNDVTVKEFDAYVADLKAAGYTVAMENTIGKNKYVNLTKDGVGYYIGFTHNTGEMRVSEDRAGVSVAEFAYDTKGEGQTQIYQFVLPEENLGMCYVIRLSDNRLVLVDGSHCKTAFQAAVDDLMNFLHKVTNTKAREKVTIAAWWLTHAHDDHVTLAGKMLEYYRNEIELERVMYNFPSYQVKSNGYDLMPIYTKAALRRFHPNVKFLKLHTGQSFSLSDAKVEVLYTQEDIVVYSHYAAAAVLGTNVPLEITDFNSTSSVLRFTIDGKTFLLLGDISHDAENTMVRHQDPLLWKSDMMQAAHHCYNYLNTLYPLISAPIVLMPNSRAACERRENARKLASILKHVKNDQIYYETEGTYGFAVVDDEFKLICEEPTHW